MKTFNYSKEFETLVRHFHRGRENWPRYNDYIKQHLGGPSSRLNEFRSILLPEIEYHLGSLENKRILDFGCGTGATTVALAEKSNQVIAFDIDEESVQIAKKRLTEHGLDKKVTFFVADDLDQVKNQMGKFDLILMNGVIEHIPNSIKGLRKKIISTLFEMLNPGGYLYISETPNRLWPKDFHSTGMWWIPWTKPGNKKAYQKALKNGRHFDVETISPGPLGFEEIGAWGSTYWQIKSFLPKGKFEVLNLKKGHNRHLRYTTPLTFKKKIIEFFLFILSKIFNAPMTAFAPGINNLVIKKIK